MHCAGCGAENQAGKNYCVECGAVLPRACPSCGSAVGSSDKFCGDCGTALSPSAVSAASRIPPMPSPSDVHGERRQVTVMFVDLVGSTTLEAEVGRGPRVRCAPRARARPGEQAEVLCAARRGARHGRRLPWRARRSAPYSAARSRHIMNPRFVDRARKGVRALGGCDEVSTHLRHPRWGVSFR